MKVIRSHGLGLPASSGDVPVGPRFALALAQQIQPLTPDTGMAHGRSRGEFEGSRTESGSQEGGPVSIHPVIAVPREGVAPAYAAKVSTGRMPPSEPDDGVPRAHPPDDLSFDAALPVTAPSVERVPASVLSTPGWRADVLHVGEATDSAGETLAASLGETPLASRGMELPFRSRNKAVEPGVEAMNHAEVAGGIHRANVPVEEPRAGRFGVASAPAAEARIVEAADLTPSRSIPRLRDLGTGLTIRKSFEPNDGLGIADQVRSSGGLPRRSDTVVNPESNASDRSTDISPVVENPFLASAFSSENIASDVEPYPNSVSPTPDVEEPGRRTEVVGSQRVGFAENTGVQGGSVIPRAVLGARPFTGDGRHASVSPHDAGPFAGDRHHEPVPSQAQNPRPSGSATVTETNNARIETENRAVGPAPAGRDASSGTLAGDVRIVAERRVVAPFVPPSPEADLGASPFESSSSAGGAVDRIKLEAVTASDENGSTLPIRENDETRLPVREVGEASNAREESPSAEDGGFHEPSESRDDRGKPETLSDEDPGVPEEREGRPETYAELAEVLAERIDQVVAGLSEATSSTDVSAIASSDATHATLELRHPDLGTFQVHAEMNEGVLSLRVVVGSSEAARKISPVVGELHRSITSPAARVRRVQVEISGQAQTRPESRNYSTKLSVEA